MPDSFFLKGLIVALVFGVPAGTIGALTIQHTLQRGFKAGVITGLGSTAADIFYACVGMCGISFVSDFVAKYQQFIRVLGGMFIILIGVSIFRKKVDDYIYAKVNKILGVIIILMGMLFVIKR